MNSFDPQVIAAMARWPNVPAVYGWLRLDRRGQWHLIDRGRPDFDPVRDAAGSPITSPPILDFIHRNYGVTDEGCWFWQNGPQRVFVDLDLAPRILRILGEGQSATLVDHTGLEVGPIRSAAMAPDGTLWLRATEHYGAIHDLDLAALDIEFSEGPLPTLRWHGIQLPIDAIRHPDTTYRFTHRPRPAEAR
jgi:hypothetical protein